MFAADVNWIAILVATVVKCVIGAIWYTPRVFGARWQALTGTTEADLKERMRRAVSTDFVMTFVTASVLAHALAYSGRHGLVAGAGAGFLAWLGFIAATNRAAYLYEGRPIELFTINMGYMLVSMLAMGAIIGAM